MRTAIFTVRETKLTIRASEELYLEQMGWADHRIRLSPGFNTVVVGPGVFKVVSRAVVHVTADAEVEVSSTLNNKDSWPLPSKLPLHVDVKELIAFFSDARSMPAPR